MADLSVESLSVLRGGATLVDSATLRVQPGELVALLGPNGAGKTSLVRATLGLETASRGIAKLSGRGVTDLTPVERARLCAYLPQSRPLAWPNIVEDVVALGRFAFGTAPGKLNSEDASSIDEAIDNCDLRHLVGRHCDTLSGGELARVHCARAFASRAPLLIADEPIAALDLRHQFRILDLIQSFVEKGGGALVILHDVTLAARYASRLVWMNEGRIIADGTPEETLSTARLEDVFRVRALVDGVEVKILEAL